MSRSLTNILFHGKSQTLEIIENEIERISSEESGIFTQPELAKNINKEKMDIHLVERIADAENPKNAYLLVAGYSLTSGPEKWVRSIIAEYGISVKYTDLSQVKNFFISIEGSQELKKIITPYISEQSIAEYGAESFYESVIKKVKGRVIYHRKEIFRIASLFLKNKYATKEDILRDWDIPKWSLIESSRSIYSTFNSSPPHRASCHS